MRSAVVYVHGLWMNGIESIGLRRRLAARGLKPQVFAYSSMQSPLTQILARLRDTIAAIEAPQVHLLGHSLGGLVIQRCLERYPQARPGRVVFIGTPAGGSRAARHLAQRRWGRRLLGAACAQELLTEHPQRWDVGRELGIIAGTVPLGLARLLMRFNEPNDGVVMVSETRLVGATGFLTVSNTHSGMLWSARVARETGSFLEYGCFGR
jgi:pimeloyl-ACP methyl ester carboxylesterase